MKPLIVYLSAILACVLTSPIFAQSDFKDGFIVDNNKNFVYGYIAFSDTPHTTCIFKEQKDGPPTTYTTHQIEGYGVINGNHYRKRPIEDLNGSIGTEDIFMEAVADGAIVLYVAFNRMFVERGISFYEVKNDKNKEMLNSYRMTLVSLMSDCGNFGQKAKSVAITIPTLKTLIEGYNACAAGGRQSTAIAKALSEFGFFLGIDRTKFSMEGTGNSPLEKKNFIDRTLLSGGFRYRFALKRSKHLSFVTGLWFNDQRLYATGKTSANGYTRVQTARINYQALRLPLMMEFGNFSVGSIASPYFKAGMSLPFMIKRNITLDYEDENNNVIYINQYKAGDDFKEPLLIHASAGISLPIKGRLHGFCEAFYSTGKNKFKLETPKTVTGNYSSVGFNVGLAIRNF